MNNKKRKVLKRATKHLEEAASLMRNVIEEEQDSLDNMPENLEGSFRYTQMEDAIEIMEDSVDDIDGIKDRIELELL